VCVLRQLVLLAAYEDIALGFLEEYVGKPFADLEDKIMQRLLDIKSSYIKSKPSTEHIVRYMQDLHHGVSSFCQFDCSYSRRLTVGYFSINGNLMDIIGLLNPASLRQMWGMAKFCGG
jgi:hypothetical protein